MSESAYIPLKVTKDEGAYIYYSGAYNSATGATGAQGWLRTEALYGNWDSVRFLNVVGSGVSTFPSANPTSANLYIATGTAFTGIGDVRGEATGLAHLPSGWLDPINGTGALLAKNTTYDAGLYAVYQGDNVYTGMVTVDATGTGNGWLSGQFTTREIYEFETEFSLDTGDLSTSGVGSGVYKGAQDVTLQYEIINKLGNALNTTSEIADDPFISGINVSILDITGAVAFANYRSQWLSPSFTFTRQDNIDVFGAYTKDFGVRYEVVNTDGGTHTSDFYCYANGLTFDKVYVEAASGAVLNESSTGNYFPPDTGGLTTTEAEDAVRYFNGQTVSPSGRTGSIAMTVHFNEDPTFTQYDSISLFSNTGTEIFTPNEGNYIGEFALEQIQAQQIVLFQEDGLDLDVDTYFLMILNSSVTHNTTNITIGPYSLTKKPEGENPFIFNVGNQTIDGNLEVDYLTGECLTIGPPDYDYPYTIHTKDGHVGIGTSTTLQAGAKMSVNGRVVGAGVGGRLTGPSDLPYLLSGDAAGGGTETLQTVTDDGNTTTNDISVGTSITPTAPVTIKTDSSDNAGVDIYADGDTSNRILTLKADSNAAGEIIVKDTAGVDSVKLSNTSSKGQADFYDAGGTARMTMVVDGNNQGKLTLKDSAGNTSIELSSDSDKRGNLGVYDAAGTLKAEIKADSNDEGIMSIKDSLGALSTKIQGHKAIMAAFDSNIYSTGSVIIAGSGHSVSGDYDTIAGGVLGNISGGNFNFIGGGSGIDITGSEYSSSIGGYNNDIIQSDQAIIGGGRNNKIESANSAVIGGGSSNEIHDGVSAIAGGISNLISGGNGYSFVGGGEENMVYGTFSSILGGEGNKVYGNDGVTLGGWFSESSGRFALVGPGKASKVSGDYAVGLGNKVEIPAAHSGATVLADGQDRVHASSGAHAVTLDFANGVYVPTIGYFAEGLHVSGVPVLTGENNPAEADTLQTVTTRGNTTTTSILSTGPHISGVTGLYSDKVGIGTNSPTELLGIAPDTDVSAEIGRAHIGNVGFSDYAGFSHVDNNSAGNFALLQAADGTTFLNCSNNEEIRFQSNNYTLGGFNGANGDFNIATDAFYVDASEDRVGVGTNSPSYTLEVTESDASSLLSRFYNTSTTNGQGLLIRAGETSNENRVLQVASRNDTKIMTVNSNGRVGIGTTTPSTALDVRGTISGYTGLFDSVDVDGSVTSVTALTDVTSTSYTFVAGDQSNTVSFNNASAMTGLIPPNSSVPFPIGTEIALFQKGAGQVHITTGSNAVTINAADGETKTRVQYSSAMCLKTGTDGWLVVGDLTS